MKYFFVFLIITLLVNVSLAQKTNPNYDAELATKLGADDYGMKKNVFLILKTGTNESTDTILKDICFTGHMNNINRLVKEKKLLWLDQWLKTKNRIEEFLFWTYPL